MNNLVILKHKIGVRSMRTKERNSNVWNNLIRQNKNNWTFYTTLQIKIPIIRIPRLKELYSLLFSPILFYFIIIKYLMNPISLFYFL